MDKPIEYPLTKTTLSRFAEDVFLPLREHNCVSCMFVAGGGKRTIIKFLLSEKEILKQVFNNRFDKTLFVYVDPDDILEMSNTAYLQIMLDKLLVATGKQIKPTLDGLANPLLRIKNIVSKLTASDWDIVFILNDFELTLSLSSSIYMNLETIMAVNKSRISYLFLSTLDLLEKETLAKMHNLKYAVSQKVVYFPLLSEKDIVYDLNLLSKKLNLKLGDKIQKMIIELCGGHPQLLKYALNILSELGMSHLNDANKTERILRTHYQLKIVCADIWGFLSLEEQQILMHIVSTNKLPNASTEPIKHLLDLALIRENRDKKYLTFGSLFEDFIKNKLPKNKITYNHTTSKIFYGVTSCENKFTFQEFKLMTYFIEHENTLISRDEVAQVLWGKKYLEKYSDWSIDKTVSTLRKKLDVIGFPSQNLSTLKKRGFSFSNK